MGALAGLMFATGVLIIWSALEPAGATRRPLEPVRDLLAEAGMDRISPAGLIAASLGCGLIVGVGSASVAQSPPIGLAFFVLGAAAPTVLVRRRRRARTRLHEIAWPDAIDQLAGGVAAGLSLPEALSDLGVRGPEPLRPAFRRFSGQFAASGRFDECLNRLKHDLADPIGDRIVESIRLARRAGGTDLGRLLRTLASVTRAERRTRAEIASKQSWTTNAARLAVAAPWAVLALLSLRPEAAAAYNSAAGILVLASGGAVSVIAYRIMLRVARLPEDERTWK